MTSLSLFPTRERSRHDGTILTLLENWQGAARANDRCVLSASQVNLGFTLLRHRQSVEFCITLSPEHKPDFYCIYPSRTWLRGELKQWIWDITPGGYTRLWVPIELAWRSLVLAHRITEKIAAKGRFTGGPGLEKYRRTDSWWVSFDPHTT